MERVKGLGLHMFVRFGAACYDMIENLLDVTWKTDYGWIILAPGKLGGRRRVRVPSEIPHSTSPRCRYGGDSVAGECLMDAARLHLTHSLWYRLDSDLDEKRVTRTRLVLITGRTRRTRRKKSKRKIPINQRKKTKKKLFTKCSCQSAGQNKTSLYGTPYIPRERSKYGSHSDRPPARNEGPSHRPICSPA